MNGNLISKMRAGESFRIDIGIGERSDSIDIKILEINERTVKVSISAPKHFAIDKIANQEK